MWEAPAMKAGNIVRLSVAAAEEIQQTRMRGRLPKSVPALQRWPDAREAQAEADKWRARLNCLRGVLAAAVEDLQQPPELWAARAAGDIGAAARASARAGGWELSEVLRALCFSLRHA